MNKEAMKQQILEALTRRLGDDFHISSKKVFKANRELDGLVIMEKDKNICPTIYLEDYYEECDPLKSSWFLKSLQFDSILQLHKGKEL